MSIRLIEMIRQRRKRNELYAQAEYWDAKARACTDSAVSMWPNQALNQLYDREQKERVRRVLGDVTGLDILDLGCGTGRFSRWLAAQGARVTGVDFSADTLELARRASGPDLHYRQGSVFELEDVATCDLVFALGVLTVACRGPEELRRALERMRRALRPGGRLLLVEPVHRGFLHRVLDLDLKMFLTVLADAGFEVRQTEPLHFWPVRLLLAYVSWPARLTRIGYGMGQWWMGLPGFRRLGDYHLIAARAARP
jgi:2-polyprenyl-3-methyl-5-hydroxy-6-metoxy-1,4-benzoquinol methylase